MCYGTEWGCGGGLCWSSHLEWWCGGDSHTATTHGGPTNSADLLPVSCQRGVLEGVPRQPKVIWKIHFYAPIPPCSHGPIVEVSAEPSQHATPVGFFCLVTTEPVAREVQEGRQKCAVEDGVVRVGSWQWLNQL